MSEETEDIETAATDPKKVSIDGVQVEQHSLADRVAAARYVKEQAAAADPFACVGHRQVRFGGER